MTDSAGIAAASPRASVPTAPPATAPIAAPCPPPAIAPIAAPVPAAIPTFAAFLPLFAAASLLTGVVTSSIFGAVSQRQSGELDREAGFSFDPPALVGLGHAAVDLGARGCDDPVAGPDRLFQNRRERRSGVHRFGRELASGSDRDHLAGLEGGDPGLGRRRRCGRREQPRVVEWPRAQRAARRPAAPDSAPPRAPRSPMAHQAQAASAAGASAAG